MRVADYIINYLADLGVTHVFTVTGGGSIFLCDALSQTKKIQYVCCHHEQAVAMATEGYARQKNALGVSLVTTGPGGTNAITGVAGSWMDSVPHLVLSGQAFTAQTIGTTGLRQLGVQEINIIDLIKPITKYALMVTDPQTIRYHLEKAIYLAQSGRPGPVWLDLPANVQNAQVEPDQLKGFTPDEAPFIPEPGWKEKIAQVAELLKKSEQPLIHIGQGIRIAGATEDFFKFTEKHGIPFVTARNANELVDDTHPLYVGRPGTFAQRGANFALQNSDFYLALGTRLSIPQTGYDAKDFAKNAKKVMVEIDRAELGKERLLMDIRVLADAKAFLAELSRQLEGAKFNFSAWAERCRSWKKNYPVVLPEYKAQKGSVNSYHFIDVLSDVLKPTDVIVTDMGFAFQNTHQAFRIKKGQRMFTNCGFASMGWGLPAAIGACFANHEKRVVCIAGEGGLMMNLQEIATMMHYRLPIKLVIFNNGGYLTIKQTQEIGFGSRYMGSTLDTGLSFPDFGKIAAAHEMPFLRLSSHDGLEQAVTKFMNADGPAICEIMMDHNQIQAPKAIGRKRPDGSTVYAALEDLHPFLDPAEVAENMKKQKKERV